MDNLSTLWEIGNTSPPYSVHITLGLRSCRD